MNEHGSFTRPATLLNEAKGTRIDFGSVPYPDRMRSKHPIQTGLVRLAADARR
jgi:hypothetical protein